ncbi:MAG TPA: group III truncated hemoglobin [Chitinophagaceae bacterium]|nr:group III truncated hemoglobin [Chitinophagaceae bacterium]
MSIPLKDITTRADIELLLESFYEKLLADKSISYIFTDVAKLDIKTHIPIITDFWESVLLNRNVYHNNTMKIHLDLNDKTPLTKLHFDVWLKHFNDTLDGLFTGDIALLAKQRAKSVATIMQIKIAQDKKLEDGHKKSPE